MPDNGGLAPCDARWEELLILGSIFMERSLDEIEDEFAEKLSALSSDARILSVVLREVDRLEAETVQRLREHGAGEIIVRPQRTLAEFRLSAARERHADIQTALDLFGRSNEIGYDTPEQKLVVTGLFSRICLENGHPELAVAALEAAMQGVNIIDERNEEGFRKLLAELRASPL